jgi:transcriptional regulator with XRE-family HTH domain
MDRTEIGQAIKDRQAELKMTNDHLLETKKVSRMTLNSLRQGGENPTLNSLIAVLDLLGLEIEVKKK